MVDIVIDHKNNVINLSEYLVWQIKYFHLFEKRETLFFAFHKQGTIDSSEKSPNYRRSQKANKLYYQGIKGHSL